MLQQKLQTFLRHPVKAVQHRFHVSALEMQHALAARNTKIHDQPVFVLGNQKSGTTILAALLAKASGRDVTLDLDHFNNNYSNYDEIFNRQLSFRRFLEMNRQEFSKPIIKEPNLTHFFPELKIFFPLARFTMVIRDPRDNIRSILNRFDLPGNQQELTAEQQKRLIGPWPLVFDGSWVGLLAENYIQMLAQRWALFAELYLENQQEIALCRYEDFLADKVGAVHRLAEAAGIIVSNDIRADVDTQYQSKGKREVEWAGFFGKTNLQAINDICEPAMRRLNYAMDKTGIKPLVCPLTKASKFPKVSGTLEAL